MYVPVLTYNYYKSYIRVHIGSVSQAVLEASLIGLDRKTFLVYKFYQLHKALEASLKYSQESLSIIFSLELNPQAISWIRYPLSSRYICSPTQLLAAHSLRSQFYILNSKQLCLQHLYWISFFPLHNRQQLQSSSQSKIMKRQGGRVFPVCESQPDKLKGYCKKTASIPVATKAPVEAESLLNINALPDLPFGALFEWIPLVDLLSVQFVCQQWKEASIREATTHRDSIMLCIDGQAEDQKTARYLERSVWNLPHAEKLKTHDGKPLYPDYVPPSQRSTWNNLLLGTRLDNPTQLDGTSPTTEEHQKWQTNYDRYFEALLDKKVSQLLALFPRGPRTLTIVCRSEHRDFLRLLPLLTNWKENLVTLNLYSSHPRAFFSEQNASHNRWSHIDHLSNRPLRAVLNCLSSLRHLTLDLLGEEGDTPKERSFGQNNLTLKLWESGEMDFDPYFTFLNHLESFTFADGNPIELMYPSMRYSTLLGPSPSLKALQIGCSISSMDGESFRYYVRPFVPLFHHVNLQPCGFGDGGLTPSEIWQNPSSCASLKSLFLNLLHTPDLERSLFFFLQYLTFKVELVHLRLHLTYEHVTRWFDEMNSLREDQRSSLPRLRVLSLILVDNQPIDHRLPSIFQRLFPSLQVIIIHQRLIRQQTPDATEILQLYLALIRRHFSESLFLEGSSLLLLEACLFLYQEPNVLEAPEYLNDFGEHLNLLQSKEHIWSVEELRAPFIH